MAGWYEFGIAGVTRINDFLPLDADWNIGGGLYTLQGLPAATAGGEPVEYNQFIGAINGLRWKEPVVAATTGNVTISNPGTASFDGITLSTGERLLVHNQSTTSQNGVYEFNGSGSALTRAPDADTWDDHINLTVFVMQGSTYADYGYTCTVDPGGTLGTTAIAFAQFNGGGIPGTHADTHKHGGADEVATATPGANAIPKAGSGGTLATGWIPDLSGSYQPLDADLTSWAGVTRAGNFDAFVATPNKANFDSLISNGAPIWEGDALPWGDVSGTPTTLVGYGIGDAQPLDADLTSWALISRDAGFDTWAATATLANLNTLLGVTLDEETAARTPLTHGSTHQNGGTDELLLHQLGEPTAAVNFNRQPLDLAAFQTWANDGARPGTPVNALLGFNTTRGVPEIYIA